MACGQWSQGEGGAAVIQFEIQMALRRRFRVTGRSFARLEGLASLIGSTRSGGRKGRYVCCFSEVHLRRGTRAGVRDWLRIGIPRRLHVPRLPSLCPVFGPRERNSRQQWRGTDIYQLTPSQLSIHQGSDKIACVKLSPKGILRWYTRCCRTPVGNTLSTPQVPFVGVPHLFMDHQQDGVTREAALGPVSSRIHARSGYGDIPADAHETAPVGLLVQMLGGLLVRRLTGKHAPSPFFDKGSGKPICDPVVLTASERKAL
jgi:Family of unknown function (DUF6151)